MIGYWWVCSHESHKELMQESEECGGHQKQGTVLYQD